MMLIEETAPAAEALPVASLREHLRLGSGFEIAEDNAETAALTGYLRAAIAAIRAKAVNAATSAAATLIAQGHDAPSDKALVDSAIGKLGTIN